MYKHNRKCLNDYDIGAYIDDRLPESEREIIENGVFACKECWEDFIAIKQTIIRGDEEPAADLPDSLIQKAVDMYPEKNRLFNLVVGFVRDSIQIMHSSAGFDISFPQLAGGMRSAEREQPSMVVINKSFDDISVELDIEKTGRDICNIRVAIDEVITRSSVKPLRVELISNGRELVSNLLENGETFLEDIGTGNYNIKIHKKGKIFGEIAIKID